MSRQSDDRAVVERLSLVTQLGGRCVDCGTTGTKRNGLELDHVTSTDWNARGKSKQQRLKEYKIQKAVGNLAARCKSCNSAKH